MRLTRNSAILIIIFFPFRSFACLPNQIHVREHWVNSYVKEQGTKVTAHNRSEHCREIRGHSYFQNSTSKDFKNLKTNFKAWNEIEKGLLNKEFENLPLWLKRYKLTEILRADSQRGNPENPAMAYPATKTLIVFDKFFTMSNKRDIVIHELSHIAIWDINPDQSEKFFKANGWIYEKGKLPKPPNKLLIPDSGNSPTEDFANHVETYYANPSKLKEFNENSYQILEMIIKAKEK